MKIDALVLRILALRQPVAYDLRFLTTALKLVTDLKRIGDEAVNIAERAKEGQGIAKERIRELLKRMSERASARDDREALEAFVAGDVPRADQVLQRDDDVDNAYGEVLDAMTALMGENPAEIAPAIRVIKVAKYIERIAGSRHEHCRSGDLHGARG